MTPDVDRLEHLFQRDQSAYPDGFVAGFYLHCVRGCASLPVRVWFGAPEEDHRVLDRAPRWQIAVSGVPLEDERYPDAPAQWDRVWPKCQREPVDEAEYLYRIDRIAHARKYRPGDPFADPRGRVDLLSFALPEE